MHSLISPWQQSEVLKQSALPTATVAPTDDVCRIHVTKTSAFNCLGTRDIIRYSQVLLNIVTATICVGQSLLDLEEEPKLIVPYCCLILLYLLSLS